MPTIAKMVDREELGYYEVVAGSSWNRFGLGFSIDWFKTEGSTYISVSIDFLFFWITLECGTR